MTNLLLLSNGGMLHDDNVRGWIARHFTASPQSPKTILYVSYALKDGDPYTEEVIASLKPLGINAIAVNSVEDPLALLNTVDGVFISGGNTFRLLDRLQKTGLLEAIKEKVEQGLPYVGSSAGTNIASPSIKTTNDMPIVQPASFDALGLVPFQINPHYPEHEGPLYYRMGEQLIEDGGEPRAKKIHEFHEENKMPVLGLRDGSALRITDNYVELFGQHSARFFQQGKDPVEIENGKVLTLLMQNRSRRIQSP